MNPNNPNFRVESDIIAEIEKAINEAAEKWYDERMLNEDYECDKLSYLCGARFILPLLKKLIEDNEKTISINHEYYGGGSDVIEMRNKSLLKLLGSET